MKKKAIKISIIMIVIVLALLVIYIFTIKNYSFLINLSWNLSWKTSLPYCDNRIYHEDNLGFHGDGREYSILQFSNDKKLKKFNWGAITDQTDIERMNDILLELKIPNKYKPDFYKEWLYIKISRRDNSTLYLLYDEANQRVFLLSDSR